MVKVKVFRYVCQRSLSRSLGQNCWHNQKGIITRNVHMKYESSTSNGSKVMAKVYVFTNVGQGSPSRSEGHGPPCYLKGFHKLSIHAKLFEIWSLYLLRFKSYRIATESQTDTGQKTRCPRIPCWENKKYANITVNLHKIFHICNHIRLKFVEWIIEPLMKLLGTKLYTYCTVYFKVDTVLGHIL